MSSIFDAVKGLEEAVDNPSVETIRAMEARQFSPGDYSGISEDIFGIIRQDAKLNKTPALREKFLTQVAEHYFKNGGV